jgi:hypothetical protein
VQAVARQLGRCHIAADAPTPGRFSHEVLDEAGEMLVCPVDVLATVQ